MFSDEEREYALQQLHRKNLDGRFEIGIKKLLMIVEVASQSTNKVEKFVQSLSATQIPGLSADNAAFQIQRYT
jgi:hypothetical protein